MRKLHHIERGAALLFILVACKGDGGESGGSAVEEAIAAGREECDRYLECAAATTPETVGALLEGYGPEGTCWQTEEISAIELCAQACAAGRENAAKVFPDVGECGECVSDADCTDAAGGARCDGKTSSCVACLADADCDGGVCDLESHECAECIQSEDCAEGEMCAERVCVPQHACEPEMRRCNYEDGPVLEACDAEGLGWTEHHDCGAEGLSCHGEACIYTAYGPCTPGGACSEDYDQCIPVGGDHGYCINEFTSCSSTFDCEEPTPDSSEYEVRCIAQMCSLGCEDAAMCPPGMACVGGTCAWRR